jgi:hypothetical protein
MDMRLANVVFPPSHDSRSCAGIVQVHKLVPYCDIYFSFHVQHAPNFDFWLGSMLCSLDIIPVDVTYFSSHVYGIEPVHPPMAIHNMNHMI